MGPLITAQKAAGAAIEDLTGRRIQGWGDDEDGAGDPYWSAHLHRPTPRSTHRARSSTAPVQRTSVNRADDLGLRQCHPDQNRDQEDQ